MPKVDVFNMKGQKVGDMNLNDGVFGVEVNEIAMHTAVVNMLANARQGTQSTKTKHEVRGGGRKPWRQKGTGRAVKVPPALPSGRVVASCSGQAPELPLHHQQEGQAHRAAERAVKQGARQ
jgi:hypothetical protein